jgi:hypothetical protein
MAPTYGVSIQTLVLVTLYEVYALTYGVSIQTLVFSRCMKFMPSINAGKILSVF